jgi:RNA polymerase sigma-70 factor (ECF subfamily)
MSDPRSDRQLVAAMNAGGPAAAAAFEALYLRYRDWVVALAYRFTGDRDLALDVMQETFLYVLRKTPGLALTAAFKTFLYPAVRHLAITACQKRGRLVSDDQALAALPATDAPASSDLGAALAEVPGIAGLPAGQREVLILRFVDDLPLAEIALALGLPLGTVKSRLHNALESLRRDPRTKAHFD